MGKDEPKAAGGLMTFLVLLLKENQPKVIGTLWASDETSAQALAPAICSCSKGTTLSVRRTEDREIPLRLFDGPRMLFS